METYTCKEIETKMPNKSFLGSWQIENDFSVFADKYEPTINAQYKFPLSFILEGLTGIPQIKNVIYHDPATIVYWQDGTKTVVKTMHGDIYDEGNGVAMAFMKKIFGSSTKFKKIVAKYIPEKKVIKKEKKDDKNNKDKRKREIGEKVIIRKDLVEGELSNGAFIDGEMVRYRGEEAIITGYSVYSQYDYLLDIGDGEWHWSEEMLEPKK